MNELRKACEQYLLYLMEHLSPWDFTEALKTYGYCGWISHPSMGVTFIREDDARQYLSIAEAIDKSEIEVAYEVLNLHN